MRFKENIKKLGCVIIFSCFAISSQAKDAVVVQPKLSNVITSSLETESTQPNASNDLLSARQVSYTFSSLGQQTPMHLSGIDGNDTLSFGSRQDEVVVKARLKLRYTYSPSMIPELSHIKISLNGEVVATIPLPKEQAGSEQIRDLELNSLYLTDFNQLQFQLIGHYTMECEDVMHSSLWADISSKSQLEMTVKPIVLNEELSILPAPFFDFHDNRRLTLPFVFGAKPSFETLHAAGVISSWFGAVANYRGARFPSLLNQLPDQHAVIFATNDERPENLELPVIEGPTITLVRHPKLPAIKLLLVLGRNGQELKQAADALVLGQAALAGQIAHIDKVNYPPRRAAYDAPNWLAVDRPVKLGELVNNPEELQVRGRMPKPLRINVRVPADLMLWQNKGVPIDLKYRYTQPVADDNSTLNVSINNQFLQTFILQSNKRLGEVDHLVLPLLEDDRSFDRGDILIPSLKVGSDNQLQFQFSFDYHRQGLCRSFQLDNVWAALDPNSVIDFSHFYHYSEMPNLSFFANSGFPFTKYADLAETTIILPEVPNAMDIEAYLTSLGQMGKSTGIPALRFTLVNPTHIDTIADQDLLFIDTSPQPELLSRWKDSIPASLHNDQRSFMADFTQWSPYQSLQKTVHWDKASEPTVIRANGPLSALVGFESPLQNGRSVIALTASTPDAAKKMLTALQDSGRISHIHGDVVFFRGDTVESSQQGQTYFVGDLPVWHWIWFHIAKHPIILALLGILSGLFVAFLCYSGLRKIARQRLKP